ncbi:hypothetical protein P8452_72390 [Trifolium repens]|nr:hypothetical protein P8452_72390 [Trifolium repens]
MYTLMRDYFRLANTKETLERGKEGQTQTLNTPATLSILFVLRCSFVRPSQLEQLLLLSCLSMITRLREEIQWLKASF